MAPRTARTPPRSPLDHEPAAVTHARTVAGLTKQRLAGRLGVSISLISEIESGTRNATPSMIIRMALVLNCPRVVLRRKTRPGLDPMALSYARRTAGLSVADLAEQVGVAPRVIEELEGDQRTAEPAMVNALATALGCPAVVLRPAPLPPVPQDDAADAA